MRSAAERISRLVRLAPRERVLLLRAWCHLLVVVAALRIVPITRLMPRRPPVAPRRPPVPPARVAWLVSVAARYCPSRPTCLPQALVVARLLRADGVDATLRIGVARHASALRAHAWVEHRGAIVFGASEAGAYSALER